MFQKEVADRITARQGEKAYGRLGVLAQTMCHASHAFDIHPNAFVPPPKVTSTVVVLEPKKNAPAHLRVKLERLTAAAFGQRRKMLRQSLKGVTQDPEALCEAVGIKPTQRAEEIGPEIFVRMAEKLDI